MKSIAKSMVVFVLCMVFCLGVLANSSFEPKETIANEHDGVKTIEKIYVLSKDEIVDNIPTSSFEMGNKQYVFSEIKTLDNEVLTKEYKESVSCSCATNDAESVVTLFSPTIDVTTEDGYTGTLKFDHSTLKLVPSTYGSRKFTVSEERTYPNLASADTSVVPKTIDKNGVTMNLSNIEWSSFADGTVNGTEVTLRYNAKAIYTGIETKNYVTSYTATADYIGKVSKELNETVTYSVMFTEKVTVIGDEQVKNTAKNDNLAKEEKKNNTAAIVAGSVFGLGVIGAGGYTIYRIVRKKRKGY